MKPVAIFRHLAHEGAGYLAEFLAERGIPTRLIAIDAGDAVPEHADDFSGLVFMGGSMSVNDDLPWIPFSLALIRDAVAKDVPVLGHCLGGQLMSKALGGQVTRNAVKEIGWGEVEVSDNAVAKTWFGETASFPAFHWHGETFSLPLGATRLLSSPYCVNQAFVLGKHLALQCHVEMTEDMIRAWYVEGAAEVRAAAGSPAVQFSEVALQQMGGSLPKLRAVAVKLYECWVRSLKRPVN